MDTQIETNAAFSTRGSKAAVFRPRFGQAFQQYFTPKWACEANALIVERLFVKGQLNVIDPTCGSGRLLAPFADRGHHTLGIELDERLISTAKRALGAPHVRSGDICAYAGILPQDQWDVAVINPPYGLWWEVANTPMAQYELCPPSSAEFGGSIESQVMVLEQATKLLHKPYYGGGLLIAILSGNFLETYPQANRFLNQHYQVIANLCLPQLFKPEYGIGIDARYLVAATCHDNERLPITCTGDFTGENPEELAQMVVNAFTPFSRRFSWSSTPILPTPIGEIPAVPDLSMATIEDTSQLPCSLSTRGIAPQSNWAGAWLKFYGSIPLQDYNVSQGNNTDLVTAYGALPNILINGSERATQQLSTLGFAVALTDHDRQSIALAAKRYLRERLPLQELSPMEYLAWYNDGPITAKAEANAPSLPTPFVAGRQYDLQVRWEREAAQVKEEDFGEGKDAYTLRTYVDRGYLIFRFTNPATGTVTTIRENDAEGIRAMLEAFGLPETRTVTDIHTSERRSWAVQLGRIITDHAARNGGLRPNPTQENDVLAMAVKRHNALLYEQGGGKTNTIAFWAELRRYARVLIVTPSSVVPGIIEDLTKWGFNVHPRALDHDEVSRLHQHKGEKQPGTQFWVASYESLGLQDGSYDAWQHDAYDRDGNFLGTHSHNHGATCSFPGCHVSRSQVIGACPQCGAAGADFHSSRGSNGGGARYCRQCGYAAWTAGTLSEATGEKPAVKGRRMAPLGARIKRLFSCVILDEVQDTKSKGSLKGETTRALKARGKAVLSGTWLKGYVTDLYWSAGWLAGFGSALWPFAYNGGAPNFLQQFGTFEFVTKEFAHTLQTGKRKLIPSISNLNRLWRLLSPFTIRRLKEDFLTDLPSKTVEEHWVALDAHHSGIYARVEESMQDTLKRELERDNPDMGVISMALWWGRYAASCPTVEGALHYAGAFGIRLNSETVTPAERRAALDDLQLRNAILNRDLDNVKVAGALDLIKSIHAAGEKVIVFTSLKGLYQSLLKTLLAARIGVTEIDGVPTKKRNDVVRKFEAGGNTVLLAGTGTLNRGVTITGANHVIILNTEWSPETTLQAEDRIHRPGQTRACHVHYILAQGTIDEHMWELINAKHAAQRAVFDKIAQFKTTEDVLAEAASANVQLQIARAIVDAPRPQPQSEPTPAPLPLETLVQAALVAQAAPLPELPAPAAAPAPVQLTIADLLQLQPVIKSKQRRAAKPVPQEQQNFFSLLS